MSRVVLVLLVGSALIATWAAWGILATTTLPLMENTPTTTRSVTLIPRAGIPVPAGDATPRTRPSIPATTDGPEAGIPASTSGSGEPASSPRGDEAATDSSSTAVAREPTSASAHAAGDGALPAIHQGALSPSPVTADDVAVSEPAKTAPDFRGKHEVNASKRPHPTTPMEAAQRLRALRNPGIHSKRLLRPVLTPALPQASG